MKDRQVGSLNHPMTWFHADSVNPSNGKSGLSCTVLISKDGGNSWITPTGAVTELSYGWYALAPSASDRDTLGELKIHSTAAGACDADVSYDIIAYDPFSPEITTGISSIQSAMDTLLALGIPARSADLSTAGLPKTITYYLGDPGLSVTVDISKDGSVFTDAEATVTDIGDGYYKVAYTGNDMSAFSIDVKVYSGSDVMFVDHIDTLDISNLATDSVVETAKDDIISAIPVAPDNAGIASIKAKTDLIPADPAEGTDFTDLLKKTDYTAPDNAGIADIKAKTDNLPEDPASNTQVNTRMPEFTYTPPDNTGIADIKAKTDTIPVNPAAVGSQMTLQDNAITVNKIADGAITSEKATSIGNVVGNIEGTVNNIVSASMTEEAIAAIKDGIVASTSFAELLLNTQSIYSYLSQLSGTGDTIYRYPARRGAKPSTIPFPGVTVWVTLDQLGTTKFAGPQISGADGYTTWLITPGVDYYFWCQADGYLFPDCPEKVNI